MQNQTFYLLVFHGSNRVTANKAACEFTQGLSKMVSHDNYSNCFLRGCEPDIHQGLELAYHKGFRNFRIIPLFLLPGSHISDDIPAAVDCFKEKFPDAIVSIAPCLCQCQEFSRLIATKINL